MTRQRFPADVAARTVRKLEYVDLATRLDDLRVPPGNRLHPLKDDRKGQHAISINDQWHFLMIAGCLTCFFRSSTGRHQWTRFLGGAILGIVALALITPLRLRLHEQPLPLDVAPQHDILPVLPTGTPRFGA